MAFNVSATTTNKIENYTTPGDVTGRTVDGVGVVQGKNLADRLRAQKGRRIRDREAIVDALTPGRHTRR